MVIATHTKRRASKLRPMKTEHNKSTTLHCASSAELQIPEPKTKPAYTRIRDTIHEGIGIRQPRHLISSPTPCS